MLSSWDGIFVGNIDLLGVELIQHLLQFNIPVLHHLGFVDPPFNPSDLPASSNYILATPSLFVRDAIEIIFSCT